MVINIIGDAPPPHWLFPCQKLNDRSQYWQSNSADMDRCTCRGVQGDIHTDGRIRWNQHNPMSQQQRCAGDSDTCPRPIYFSNICVVKKKIVMLTHLIHFKSIIAIAIGLFMYAERSGDINGLIGTVNNDLKLEYSNNFKHNYFHILLPSLTGQTYTTPLPRCLGP